MIITKSISVGNIIRLSWRQIIALLIYMSVIAALYYFNVLRFAIPWVPVSVIGTAVSFYVGFKNNQSYDRLWEARKIWGGIVNESRTWGMMVDSYINNIFRKTELSADELHQIKKRLIYRHIGWLYAHRSQLLVPTPWEHISQSGGVAKTARMYQENFGIGLLDDEVTRTNLKLFLGPNEHDQLVECVNTATQIINAQSRDLKQLRTEDTIDDFRNIQLEDVLRSFYDLQGKNERIKKFPLPRQYTILSQYFIGIFIGLIPFSLVPEMRSMGDWGFVLAVLIATLVSWVFVMMEIIGDYSENPFSGMPNDVPMLSICRTIEIDLREMLNEKELPPQVEAQNGILL